MKTLKIISLLALVAIIATGCKKKIRMSFYNNTDRPVNVIVEGPGRGTGEIGTVLPGRTISTKIKVRKKYLPDEYHWSAGPAYKGTMTLTKHSPKTIFINIGGEEPRQP